MEYIINKIRRLLEYHVVYDIFQYIVGGYASKKRFIEQFVHPYSGVKILDIGCGSGKMLDYLPVDIEYVGFDPNSNYIGYAKRKYKKRGTFFCVNTSNAPNNGLFGKFDIVIACGILHHLDNIQAERLFKISYDNLKKGGFLFTYDSVYIPGQSSLSKYIISKDRGQYTRSPNGYLDLGKKYFASMETSIHDDLLRIPYTAIIIKSIKQE